MLETARKGGGEHLLVPLVSSVRVTALAVSGPAVLPDGSVLVL